MNTNTELNSITLENIVKQHVVSNKLNAHIIESADNFYENGLKSIICDVFKIEFTYDPNKIVIRKNNNIDYDKPVDYKLALCSVVFTDVNIGRPSIQTNDIGKTKTVSNNSLYYPTLATRESKHYLAPVTVDCTVTLTVKDVNGNDEPAIQTNITGMPLFDIPVIVKSSVCNLRNIPPSVQLELGEDPDDEGGYLSIGSNEYFIESVENQQFNIPKIYINSEFADYKARGELMSKYGDSYQNSYQVLVHYAKDDAISIELNRNELKDIKIPVGIFFKAIGCQSDSEIFDVIVPNTCQAAKELRLILKNAFTTSLYNKDRPNQSISTDDAIMWITRMCYNASDKHLEMSFDDYSKLNAKNISDMFDTQLLIHIGNQVSDRPEKIRFMGTFVKEVLLTSLNIIPQTDRDSYANKRIHAAGENFGKAIKKVFNESVVRDTRTRMMELMSKSHDNIRGLVLKDIIQSDNTKQGSSRDFKFTNTLVKAITVTKIPTAVKSVKTTAFTSSLPTKLIQRKNELNVASLSRQISASESASSSNSKQSERAHEMRRVHFSNIGYICIGQSSAEGEKVGIDKQLAVYARLSTASSSEALKEFIKQTSYYNETEVLAHIKADELETEGVYPEKYISNSLADRHYLWSIHVNGHNIGYTADCHGFMNKYKNLRRQGKLPDRETTISWDKYTQKIHFFVDYGRLLRPLMIVENNLNDPQVLAGKKPFEQKILITKEDILTKKTLTQLIEEGKVEYISPEEQANSLICPSYDKFINSTTNNINIDDNNVVTQTYTHVDYYCSHYGIPVLSSILSNYNQATRNVFQGNQAKQTCGLYALNWHKRIDKETFLQYSTDNPMTVTYTNSLLKRPNGANVMIAVLCYGGYNQEDSIIVNKTAIERGLFNGSKFTSHKAEFNQKDREDGISNKPEYKRGKLEKYVSYVLDKSGQRMETIQSSTYIAKVGSALEYNDVLIQKFSPSGSIDKKLIDTSVVNRDTDICYLQDSIKSRDADNVNVAKVSIRKPRPVSIGDKFSSRSGQKGICSYLMDEADLPFTRYGVKPDIIFNPQGFPTRMTIAQLYEPIINTFCAIRGKSIDCSPFTEIDIDSINKKLEEYNITDYGRVEMYSGMTGEKFTARVFFGPVFYQRLQKFVDDSAYCVKDARIDGVTRQPTDGMKDNGGLRVGEMEKEVISGHGSIEILREKFRDHSDKFDIYVCKNCGNKPVVNNTLEKYECPMCLDNSNIAKIESTYTANLLLENLKACNINVKLHTAKPVVFVESDETTDDTIEEYDADEYDDEDEELSDIEEESEDEIELDE